MHSGFVAAVLTLQVLGGSDAPRAASGNPPGDPPW